MNTMTKVVLVTHYWLISFIYSELLLIYISDYHSCQLCIVQLSSVDLACGDSGAQPCLIHEHRYTIHKL